MGSLNESYNKVRGLIDGRLIKHTSGVPSKPIAQISNTRRHLLSQRGHVPFLIERRSSSSSSSSSSGGGGDDDDDNDDDDSRGVGDRGSQDRVRYIGLIKIVDIPFSPHVEQEERIHVRVEQRRTRGDVDVKRAIGGAM
ncbi:uncharacterized protein [Temnothorax longispinosus]